MKLDKKYYPVLAAAISLIIFSIGINRLFIGHHDWNSVVYSNIARNHLRYGLLQTKLAMVTNSGITTPENFTYFTHYPPLMPLLLALSFLVFGISEFSARLVAILSCAALVYFLFKIAHKYFNLTTAIFTSIFLSLCPMLLYFSKIPVHETIVLGFTGAAVWYYLLWFKDSQLKNFQLTLLFIILAQLTSWSGFYLSAILPLHFLIFNQKQIKKQKLKLFSIFIIAIINFIIHNLHMALTTDAQAHQTMFEVVLFRLNLGEKAQMYNITISKFIVNQLRITALYFTRIMGLLSFSWIIWALIKVKNKKIDFKDSIVFLVLVFGFTHNLVFRNLSFIHDYMLIYAAPFFTLSAAIILDKIYAGLKIKSDFKLAIIGIVFLLFVTERLEYLNALKTHGMNNPVAQIGQSLQKLTRPQEKILVLSPQYMEFNDVFLKYYADRKVQPAQELTSGYLESYDYVFIPKSHDYVSVEDKQTLSQFSFIDQPHFILYDIKPNL